MTIRQRAKARRTQSSSSAASSNGSGDSHRDWFKTKRLRYRECVIEVDDEVLVFGGGMLEPDPKASQPGMYRQGQPLRLRFGGTAKHPLVIRAPR